MHATAKSANWFRGATGRRYVVEIAVIVLAKVTALLLLYWLVVALQPRADTSTQAMRGHVLDTPVPAKTAALP